MEFIVRSDMPSAIEILNEYLSENNLKRTAQRRLILEAFLRTEHHVTVEDLYGIVQKKDRCIGQATVFRAMKLFADAGIARSVSFGDRTIRYEHKYKHEHHDHLICERCGRSIEVLEPEIEKLQEKICKKHGFRLESHTMSMFGVCRTCTRKKGNGRK